MDKQKIFVFRISKGNKGGNPIGKCPMDYRSIKSVISNLTEKDITPIDYDNNDHLQFIYNEFWTENTLRQGWGIKNLDLRKDDPKEWIEHYMFNGKIYWNADITCNAAKGRYNILQRMIFMEKDDILLLPKTSSSGLDDPFKFTVCQIEKPYYFDLRDEIQDFGHCLKVKNKKEFEYSSKSLQTGDFGTPYLWAVTEVNNNHKRLKKFKEFIQKNYPM